MVHGCSGLWLGLCQSQQWVSPGLLDYFGHVMVPKWIDIVPVTAMGVPMDSPDLGTFKSLVPLDGCQRFQDIFFESQ